MARWLTLKEAANCLKMDKSTICKLDREGNIPAHCAGRIWRFHAAELDEWMKQSPDISQMSQSGVLKVSASENQDGKETKAS